MTLDPPVLLLPWDPVQGNQILSIFGVADQHFFVIDYDPVIIIIGKNIRISNGHE